MKNKVRVAFRAYVREFYPFEPLTDCRPELRNMENLYVFL